MANFSNYLENAIASWLTATTMPAAPTTLYVALFSSDPTDAAAGTELTTTITGTANRVGVAGGSWTKITAQTYHAYESTFLEDYKKNYSKYPILNDNCDPDYKE